MSPLNITVSDMLNGVKACGRGDGADGTPYGAVDLGLAAGLPSAVIVILILVVRYRYLDARISRRKFQLMSLQVVQESKCHIYQSVCYRRSFCDPTMRN